MFTVFLRSDKFGNEEFRYDTLDDALAAIGQLYSEANGDGIEREIGLRVNAAVVDEHNDE